MEPLDSTSPKLYFIYSATTGLLYAAGCVIDNIEIYFTKHQAFFEFTKVVSSDLAWWGGSAVALVTVIRFLQDNGFLPKGKAKK
jgi:hypothetical protein